MSLHHHIDVYCERTDFTFWSEPINAITNLVFIIAGIFTIKSCQDCKIRDGYAAIMIILLFAIGIGSFLPHTLATRWAALVDIIPIGLIILTYHVATMHRIAGWNVMIAGILFLAYPMLGWVVYQLPLEFMGSTKAYLPILPMLLVYYAFHLKIQNDQAKYVLGTFFVFSLSITARVLDYKICDYFPMGTHFMWHICNGIALYLAFHAYIHGLKKLKKI